MVYGLRVLGYRVLGIGLASFRPFRVDRVWNFGRGPCVGSDALQIGNEVVRFMVFGLRLPHCTTRANPGTPDLSCLHDMICSAASVAAGGSNKLSSKLAACYTAAWHAGSLCFLNHTSPSRRCLLCRDSMQRCRLSPSEDNKDSSSIPSMQDGSGLELQQTTSSTITKLKLAKPCCFFSTKPQPMHHTTHPKQFLGAYDP